jgi:hypothetical protein
MTTTLPDAKEHRRADRCDRCHKRLTEVPYWMAVPVDGQLWWVMLEFWCYACRWEEESKRRPPPSAGQHTSGDGLREEEG